MRVYRWVILTSLAGLTVILLGTAVYALQTPPASSITYNELHKLTQQDVPLQSQKLGADYLAIVADAPGFMDALTPLLDHREETGLQVTAISLDQIASDFGNGEPTPQAIRDFIEFAASNWKPAPQFVLLVGDATIDAESDYLDAALLPTHFQTDQTNSSAASDSWYTNFDNLEKSMTIGRFPVQSAQQLTAVVNKTIAYETAVAQSPDAHWLQRALLIADDEPYFDMATEHLEDKLDKNGYHIHDLHMSQSQDIYANIVSVINRGVGILNYSGHGSETSFADGIAFTADDARLLQNEHRLPIFTAFSCENGDFTHPKQVSIAEQLLLSENGGIVAAIGTSSPMETHSSLAISSHFFSHLLQNKTTTLGEVLHATQQAVSKDEELEAAVHTYNLLGDPALQFQQPPQPQIVRPIPLPENTTLVNDQ